MHKFVRAFTILMLVAASAFSQKTYTEIKLVRCEDAPNGFLILADQDTIPLLLIGDVRKLNAKYDEAKECDQVNQALERGIRQKDSAIDAAHTAIADLRLAIMHKTNQAFADEQIVDLQSIQIMQLRNQLKAQSWIVKGLSGLVIILAAKIAFVK